LPYAASAAVASPDDTAPISPSSFFKRGSAAAGATPHGAAEGAAAAPRRAKRKDAAEATATSRERLMEQTNASLAMALGGCSPSWRS